MIILLVEYELFMGRSLEIDSHAIVPPRPGAIEIVGCDSAESHRSITRRFLPKFHSKIFMVGGALVMEPIDGIISDCGSDRLVTRVILNPGDCYILYLDEAHRIDLLVQ